MKRALLLSFALAACASAPPPTAAHPLLGKVVALDLPTDSGKLIALPWKGPKSYVLDFWGPTCKPCKEKMPSLVARKSDIEAKGGSLVLVAVLEPTESADQAKAVLASWGVHETFLVSDTEAARSRASVSALPSTLVLNARGTLVWAAPVTATADDVVHAMP